MPAVLLCLIVYFFRDPLRRDSQRSRPVGRAGRRQSRRDHPAGARRVNRRPGRADRHFPVDFQRTLESGPGESRVIALRYSPGEFLNALNPESAIRNENTWIGLEDNRRRTGG